MIQIIKRNLKLHLFKQTPALTPCISRFVCIKLDFLNCFVSKQRLKDTCGLFFKMLYFDGLPGCPFENRSYAGFAEAANAGFKSFKPSKSLQDKIFGI